jgi:hypothetical protein
VDTNRAGPDAAGKAEWERFGDGDERFKVRLRKLALADGASLDIHVMDAKVGSTSVRDGSALFVLQSSDGRSVPAVREGDRVVVALEGGALFGGVFVRD